MTKKILIFSVFLCSVWGFSQQLKPIAQKVSNYHKEKKTFQKFEVFEVDNTSKKLAEYKKTATDISVLKLKKEELKKLVHEKPEFLEVSFPFRGDQKITVELYRNQIFTNDFKVTTGKGEAINYTPGVYYQGIVKGDNESIVGFSFFDDDVVAIASTPHLGNLVVGKVKDAEDFVSYSESTLTGKNPNICGANDLKENQAQKISYDPQAKDMAARASNNCVRIFYELTYRTYQNNNYNTTTATNWMTAIHNNVVTLYNNDAISVSMSGIHVWSNQDPYYGSLDNFRSQRTSFNGDLAHLVDMGSAGVAYLNGLCSNVKYGYSGVFKNYSNVPTYSWTVGVVTHEIGHNLGSPHTHDCSWNGNNTAIDACGSYAGYGGGCNASIPSGGGTIMSYCHMSQAGINFSNGFGNQPGTLIRNTIASKQCLGSGCTTTTPPTGGGGGEEGGCTGTVSSMGIGNITNNSADVYFNGTGSNTWKYRLITLDGIIIKDGTTSSLQFNISNLQSGTYYKLFITPECKNEYQKSQVFLTNYSYGYSQGMQMNMKNNGIKSQGNNVKIYPNPAKDVIVISSMERLKSYKIYDESGRLVLSSSVLSGNNIKVDLSSINTGSYIISIETERETINEKLIKR
ncbi:zinc-dependent metalloprotease [Chryseobacterium fistulae]|uniref:Peptidase M12B domain-containing protein n=1 Tax=Chryseobacterium fistulae TaxID=2675058 RepID=A0A6N4XM87_9FLAO|nr:zinc-dependent metalloprotease [Chryseobacterium fistulae]CAA7386887.1 hypothetical protein CHRY9393_01188 [Chryseobacterium fistulae]